jgi:hypothetical protein
VFTDPLPSNGLFLGYSLLRECVLGEPLASNGLPFCLHYSGFQALCHSIFAVKSRISYMKALKRHQLIETDLSFIVPFPLLGSVELNSFIEFTEQWSVSLS